MMRSRIFALGLAVFCLLGGVVGMAQAVAPVADYAGPVRVDLSGMWEFRLDAKGEGEAGRWFAGEGGGEWMKLVVPGSYNELLAKDASAPELSDTMRFYQGAAWYRTSFASPACGAGKGMLCYLHVAGTVLRHKVWVNGELVGASAQPFLDAAYDVTGKLKQDGANVLVIEVDNSIEKRAIPDARWHGWWDDGGLIRPVYMELRPEMHGQSYVTTTMRKGGGWELTIDTVVRRGDGAGSGTVGYALTDRAGKVVWRSGGKRAVDGEVMSVAVVPGVAPWSPEHPVLYTLATTTRDGKRVDVTRVRIGFRQVEVKGTRILLNGAPVTLRGITRHQFLAGAGMSLTVAQDRKDIEDLKALGANFVRLAHYSQSQDVYDACDELGMMVWTEIPAWQSSAETLSDEVVWKNYAQPQLEQMVAQHRNHPSVVVWSVANEIPSEKPEVAAYVAKAIAYVKTLDQSRLVTFASDRRERDVSLGPVDFVAVNEYFGWYYGKQEDVGPMLDKMHELYPGKPIVVSEYGAEAVAGWDRATAPAKSRDYSYEAQSSFLKTHMEQIYAPGRRGYVAGGVIWVYNDFPDPHHPAVGDQPVSGQYRNSKGIVTMDREKKPAYGVVREFFEREAGR